MRSIKQWDLKQDLPLSFYPKKFSKTATEQCHFCSPACYTLRMTSESTSRIILIQAESQQPPTRIELRSDDDVIVLKQLIPEDAEHYFGLVDSGREHLSQHGDTTAEKYLTVESVRRSIEMPNANKYRFGIWDQGIMVGTVNLSILPEHRGESGSWVGAAYIGSNYAARARTLLIDFGFNQLHLQEIISKIAQGNIASQKSVSKSGFVLSDNIIDGGESLMLYVIKNPNITTQDI